MQLKTIAATALLGLASLTAQATTQANLNLSNFGAVLTDINLGDGLAPSLAWANNWSLSTGSSDQNQLGWDDTQNIIWGDHNILSDQQSSPVASLNNASAFARGHQSVSTLGQGFASMSVQHSVEVGEKGFSQAFLSQQFTLSAGTQATFSMSATGGLSGSAYAGGWTPNGGPGYSNAWFQGRMYVGDVSTMVHTMGSGNWYWPEAYEATIDGVLLNLTVKNSSTVDRVYYLSIAGLAGVDETMAPVPEPSTYALMVLGLAAIGATARRRSGKA